MRKTSPVVLGALAMAIGIGAHPASATSTAGWSEADRSAATIREFQTRLMVAALRCRAAGIDVLASYNQFIAADRAELAAANERLKVHFKSASPVTGDRDYDRYTTSLANGFAGEQWSPQSCDGAAHLAREAAQSKDNLLAVAARDSDLADSAPPRWSSPATRDRPVPQTYADRGPPPGYYGHQPSPPAYDEAAPYPGDRDDRRSQQADDDQGPPPGYYDNSPSWHDRDDRQSRQAYNDRSPPPGYQSPERNWDGPYPAYNDGPAPRGDGY